MFLLFVDALSSGLGREVQLFIKAERLQSSESLHPEILPAEEGKADLLLCHGLLVLDFLYHNYPEILERVVVRAKMLVDFY